MTKESKREMLDKRAAALRDNLKRRKEKAKGDKPEVQDNTTTKDKDA